MRLCLLLSIIFLRFSPIQAISQDELQYLKSELARLFYIRAQMDCYTDKIDGKIEAYHEIIQYFEPSDL